MFFNILLQVSATDEWWSLATDGSSDVDDKYFPFIIRHWDDTGRVVPTFVDMPVCNQATAANIFGALDECAQRYKLRWERCCSYAGDNATVNSGIRNSIMSRIKEKQPDVYSAGCSCHLSNLAAEKGGRVLSISISDLLIDLYYHFDKSCKHKDELQKFQDFCNEKVRKVIKHVTTRWLSLGHCIERLLQMWDSLYSYFITNFDKDGDDERDPGRRRRKSTAKGYQNREDRVVKLFKNESTKAYALFLHAVIPAFDAFNILLQREDPMIHAVHPTMVALYQKILAKLVRPDALAEQDDILEVDFEDQALHREDQDLFVGFATRQYLRSKDLPATDLQKLYGDVRKFYIAVLRCVRHCICC